MGSNFIYAVPSDAGLKAKKGFYHEGTDTWFPFLKDELVYVTSAKGKYYLFDTPFGLYKRGCKTLRTNLRLITQEEYEEKFAGKALRNILNNGILGIL